MAEHWVYAIHRNPIAQPPGYPRYEWCVLGCERRVEVVSPADTAICTQCHNDLMAENRIYEDDGLLHIITCGTFMTLVPVTGEEFDHNNPPMQQDDLPIGGMTPWQRAR